MRRFFSFFVGCFMLLSVAGLYAENEIYVTKVTKVPAAEGSGVKEIATIVLNDCLEVRDIGVVKAEGMKTLKYPVYISKNGKEYPQFEVITKQAKDEIEKAVFGGKPSAKTSKVISFKISKFSKFTRPSSLKAFVSVDFNNAVRVECKVMESKKGPWISWPSVKDEATGKYPKQVLIINKKVKGVVEKSIMDKYTSMGSESSDSAADEE